MQKTGLLSLPRVLRTWGLNERSQCQHKFPSRRGAIELSSSSKSTPSEQVAESQQGARQAIELPEAEGESRGGRPQKRPRVDEVSPSDALSEIIPRPSDRLQEVSGTFLCFFLSLSFFFFDTLVLCMR